MSTWPYTWCHIKCPRAKYRAHVILVWWLKCLRRQLAPLHLCIFVSSYSLYLCICIFLSFYHLGKIFDVTSDVHWAKYLMSHRMSSVPDEILEPSCLPVSHPIKMTCHLLDSSMDWDVLRLRLIILLINMSWANFNNQSPLSESQG